MYLVACQVTNVSIYSVILTSLWDLDLAPKAAEDSSEIHTTATMSQRETHHRFDSVQCIWKGPGGRPDVCWGVEFQGRGGAMFWSSSYPSFQDKAWQPAGTQNRRDGLGASSQSCSKNTLGSSPRRTPRDTCPLLETVSEL